MTINISALRGSPLSDLRKGDLFLGRAASDPQFIVGSLDETPVVVNLRSDKFDISPLEAVKGRRGLVARNAQLFVHLDARNPVRLVEEPSDMIGALVISGEQIALLARNLRYESLHFVSLMNEPIAEDVTGAVAFMDWAICVQDGSGAWNKLYEFGEGRAAEGLERL